MIPVPRSLYIKKLLNFGEQTPGTADPSHYLPDVCHPDAGGYSPIGAVTPAL